MPLLPLRALGCFSLRLAAGEDLDVSLETTGLCRTSPDIVRQVSGMQMLEMGRVEINKVGG